MRHGHDAGFHNAALVVFLPQENYWFASRLLIGWDAGVALYLVLVIIMILRADPGRVRRESPLLDWAIAILILTVTAGLASWGRHYLLAAHGIAE